MFEMKVKIAYATGFGSTKEVADYIASELKRQAIDTDVDNVEDINSLDDVTFLIIGTAIRMERPLPQSVNFVKKFSSKINTIPTAVFSLGATMKKDNAEARSKTENFLKPVLSLINNPVRVGLFPGKIDYGKLPWIWKNIAARDSTGLMEEGDFRDWDVIRQWTLDLISDIEAKKNSY